MSRMLYINIIRGVSDRTAEALDGQFSDSLIFQYVFRAGKHAEVCRFLAGMWTPLWPPHPSKNSLRETQTGLRGGEHCGTGLGISVFGQSCLKPQVFFPFAFVSEGFRDLERIDNTFKSMTNEHWVFETAVIWLGWISKYLQVHLQLPLTVNAVYLCRTYKS